MFQDTDYKQQDTEIKKKKITHTDIKEEELKVP